MCTPINKFFPIVPFRASILFHLWLIRACSMCILQVHIDSSPRSRTSCRVSAYRRVYLRVVLSTPTSSVTPQCPCSFYVKVFLLNFVYSTQQCNAHRGVWFHIICLPQSLPPLFSSHCWVQLHTVSWPLFSREITLLYSGNWNWKLMWKLPNIRAW